ncbi:CopG family antitoxin [Salipiger marinus]|uniref:Predicted DNA binding protein, CopG/RHH family n=1 Tax=Salipiger marinus TaxID=555512 RepID=A0A1G8U8U6_9RHOB|nr:BrnA antitoxin family protein [Salipiger marinus]SDJ50169.1 Predicted DNA binding protein, CopG/RHH family [Salipiger marinus]
MSNEKTPKPFPSFKTDEEAERFVDQADLTDYDLSGFKPASFEFAKKGAQVNLRVPQPLLDAVKTKAKAQGIPFTRYIRMLMEQDIAHR